MTKYRRLNIEELEALETEFVRFLAAQSITADDWIKIKKEDKKRENELLDTFSDVVIEKSIYNVKYLEQRTEKRMLCYKVEEKEILLQGIEIGTDITFDFREEFPLSKLVTMFEDPNTDINFILGNKDISENKLKEVFDLIEEGAMISLGSELYDFIGTLKEHFAE